MYFSIDNLLKYKKNSEFPQRSLKLTKKKGTPRSSLTYCLEMFYAVFVLRVDRIVVETVDVLTLENRQFAAFCRQDL